MLGLIFIRAANMLYWAWLSKNYQFQKFRGKRRHGKNKKPIAFLAIGLSKHDN